MRIQVVALLAMVATLGSFNYVLCSLDGTENPSTTSNPYRAPIFRETDLDGDNTATESSSQTLDSSMPVVEQIEKLYSVSMASEGQEEDPAAYIRMASIDEYFASSVPQGLGPDEQPQYQTFPLNHIFEVQRMQHALATAKAKLNLMFKNASEPSRGVRDMPALRLGASLLPHETLASNINSYVPEGFHDGEISHMFKLNEALRTGEKSLNATELAEINSRLLSLYLRALAGLKVSVNIEPASERDNEECPICSDILNAEQAFHLSCGHKFHTDCVVDWIKDKFIQKCPLCRQYYRQSFDLSQTQ